MVDEKTINLVKLAIGTAEWKLGLYEFLDAVESPDDSYWREKFLEFKELAKALNNFDAHTLTKIVNHVIETTNTPVVRKCSICGGEGEHDWEVHSAEHRAAQRDAMEAHWIDDGPDEHGPPDSLHFGVD